MGEGIEDSVIYSFFVAGHAYGNPMNYNLGLYESLIFHQGYLNEYPKMQAGFFTGDLVPKSEENYWQAAESDLANFIMPIYIAPGNHDKGPCFDKRFPHYFSMGLNNDLFIVLDPVNCRISDEQLSFLEESITDLEEEVNNVFLFCHEVIWIDSLIGYDHLKPNSMVTYQGTDYWTKIHPLLIGLDKEVYFFAGDVGALTSVTFYSYEQRDNVHFYAGGMGNGFIDNIFITEVYSDGYVKVRPMRLNADYLEELEF